MLGTACFQLCSRISRYHAAVALLNVYRFSLFPSCTFHLPRRHAAASTNSPKRLLWPHPHHHHHHHHHPPETTVADSCLHAHTNASSRFCFHAGSCAEGDVLSYATIWHGLVPSHHPLISAQRTVASCPPFQPFPCEDPVESDPSFAGFPSLQAGAFISKQASAFNFSSALYGNKGCLLDGSWNVAWDSRPARWLHGRNSAWLLFGVCTCFLATTDASYPPDNTVREQLESYCETMAAFNGAVQQKPVLKDYDLISIPGDGRCLFRAVSHGAHVRMGKFAPDEDGQRRLADELRSKVVDELVKRRRESEWFIEGDFDTYVEHMREHNTWGGEPELLMASHVLKMPITVYLYDINSGGLIPIAEYGLEHGKENPVRLLYHGSGHYDLIQVTPSKARSKL